MEAVAPHEHDQGIQRARPSGGTLADVLDRILDKGLVIDAWVQVSLLGLELLTIEARVVVASIETYLKYADAIAGARLSARPPATAAPAPTQERGPEPAAVPAPSEDEVVGYLTRHARGAGLDAMAEHFGVARAQLEGTVSHLLEQDRVRHDERRDVLLYQGPRPRSGGPRRFSLHPWSNR